MDSIVNAFMTGLFVGIAPSIALIWKLGGAFSMDTRTKKADDDRRSVRCLDGEVNPEKRGG